MDYQGKPNIITRAFKSRRRGQERQGQRDGSVRRTWTNIAGFKDGGKGHDPGSGSIL